MGDEGAPRRIRDRLRESYNQIIICKELNLNGTVNPIPLRERTALNVVGQRFRPGIRCSHSTAWGRWWASRLRLPDIFQF
jgi:hypothetical protein